MNVWLPVLPRVPVNSTVLVPAVTFSGMVNVPDSSPVGVPCRAPPGRGWPGTAMPSKVMAPSGSPGPQPLRSNRTVMGRRYSSAVVVSDSVRVVLVTPVMF